MAQECPVPVVTAARPLRLRPFISANFVMTWDGRVTTRRKGPVDFGSRTDKRHLVALRGLADAVMVGRVTAETDATALRVPDRTIQRARLARGQSPQPLRVIVTGSGSLPGDLRLFAREGAPVIIYTTGQILPSDRLKLGSLGEVVILGESRIEIGAVMRDLHRRFRVRHLHVEGGPGLFETLAGEGLLDELHLTLCPLLFGGEEAPSMLPASCECLPRSIRWRLVGWHPRGRECFLRYVRAR